eukprot:CAMPEP_0180480836 /NCGR_PEP_ID=MMETSP1036_2-20121128/34038_1 /TAXON_ID=632150 /ORGANISM="Azadinium spinosum, Strain 3D9" /LENGTH=563 /DNA_ID=CAMNT_0022488477 /DNA_START=65 /DNA_END=1756 /DNA_ORIENTATION=-
MTEADDTKSTGSELQWTHRCCGGIIRDVKRRYAYYKSDWVDAFTSENLQKTSSTVSFLFFACLSPAIAFGTIFEIQTEGQIGVVEAIISSATAGIIYSLTSGQPLAILGGTGPGLAYTVAFYQICKMMDIEFLPARVWQGLWCSLITVIMAVTDCCALMSHATRFVEEIFSALISLIFIKEALVEVIEAYYDRDESSAFLTTLLCFGTCILAFKLRDVKKTNWMNQTLRTILSNFAVTIAIFVIAGISRIWSGEVNIEWLDVPEKLEPTYRYPDTNQRRSWFINPFGEKESLPTWVIFATFIPGLGMAFLNYMDQNLTTLLINRPTSGLKKPVGYHLDLLICGIVIYPICSVFGLPFPCAATVRSLTHLIALTYYEEHPIPGGGTRKVAAKVVEQRWTHFAIHMLIAFSLLLSKYLKYIPKAVLFGVFLYMGVSSITGNQLFDRIWLWGMFDPKTYPQHRYVKLVKFKQLHLFTFIQATCLVILYALKSIKQTAVVFPFFIGFLVFVRKGMSRFRLFSEEELAELDAHEDLAPDPVQPKGAASVENREVEGTREEAGEEVWAL